MKITRYFVVAVISIASLSLSSHAQRQTKLYIDDGTGLFMILKAGLGGGTLTLPTGTGMIVTEPIGSPAGTGLILQPNPAPGTAQTGNFNITGSGTIGTTLFATDIEDLVGLTINTVAGKNTTIGNSSGTTSISGSGWGITNAGAATLTSISGLSTPLSIGQGGTGQSSFGAGVLTSNGTTISSSPTLPLTDLAAPISGVLTSNGTNISISSTLPLTDLAAPISGVLTSNGTNISISSTLPLNDLAAPISGVLTSNGTNISISSTLPLTDLAAPISGVLTSNGTNVSISSSLPLNDLAAPISGVLTSNGTNISISSSLPLNDLAAPISGVLTSNGTTFSISSSLPLNDLAAPISGVLTSNGTNVSISTVNLTSATYVSGTLPLGNGGTNNTSYTSGKFIAYDGTSELVSTAYDNTSFAPASGSGSYIRNGTSQQTTADFNIADVKSNGSIATITNNGDNAGQTATELTLIDAPGATGTHIGININVAGGASPSYDITGSNSSWNIKNNGNFTTNGTIETGNPSTGGALVIMQGIHSYTLQAATGGSANPTFQLPAKAAGTYTLATTADISSAVATGTAGELAIYTGTNAVGSDATLADDGTTLTYSGTGGIDATNGGVTTNVTSAAAFYAQNGGFWSGTNGSVAGTLSLSDAVHNFAGKLQTIATGLSGNQVYSLPDATGTLALTSDITTAVSGTQNYVAKFGLGGNTVGNSLIFDNGTNVGIGTASPVSLLSNTSANTAFPGGSQGSGTGALTWATNSGGYAVSINNADDDPTAHGLGIGVADNTGVSFGINVTNTNTTTSLFSVLANGNTSVAGTLSSEGNSTIGTNDGTTNSFGSGAGDLNNIGVGDGVTNSIGNDVTSAGGTTNDIGIEAFGGAITNNIGITRGSGSIVTNNIGVNSEDGAATVTNNFGVDVYGTATVVNNYGAANTTNNFAGTSSFTGSVNLALSTDPLKINGSAGTSGYVLTSGGPSAAPTWTMIPTGNFIMNQTTQQSAADFNITDAQANTSVATITNTGDVAAETATELTLYDAPGGNAGEHVGLSINVAGGATPSYDVYGTSGNWKVDNAGNLLTNGAITSTSIAGITTGSTGTAGALIIGDGVGSFATINVADATNNPTFNLPAEAAGTYTLLTSADGAGSAIENNYPNSSSLQGAASFYIWNYGPTYGIADTTATIINASDNASHQSVALSLRDSTYGRGPNHGAHVGLNFDVSQGFSNTDIIGTNGLWYVLSGGDIYASALATLPGAGVGLAIGTTTTDDITGNGWSVDNNGNLNTGGAITSTLTPGGFVGDGSLITGLSADNISTGTLGVANGGTGNTTAGTDGQIIISNGSIYQPETMSGDATITDGGDITGTQAYNADNATSATTAGTATSATSAGSAGNLSGTSLSGDVSNIGDAVTVVSFEDGNNIDGIAFGDMAGQNPGSVAITGGSIDGTAIGSSSANTGEFTTMDLTSTNAIELQFNNTGSSPNVSADNWNIAENGTATFNGGISLSTTPSAPAANTLQFYDASSLATGSLTTQPLTDGAVSWQLPAAGGVLASTGNVVVLSPATAQTITPTSDGIVPLTIAAHSNSQSADLQDWDNFSQVQASIDANGDGSFQSLTASNAPGTGIAVLNVSNTNGSGTNIVAELTETVGAGNTHEGLVFNVAGATNNYDIVGTGGGLGNWNVSSAGAGTFASVTNTGHVIATSNGTSAETGTGVTVTDKPVFIITGTFGGTVTSSLPASGTAAGDMIVVINESNTLEQFTLTQTAGIAPGASRTFYWDGSHWQ